MIKDYFLENIEKAIECAVKAGKLGAMTEYTGGSLNVERPKNPDFGDYAINVSSLARSAKIAPPAIANAIVEFVDKEDNDYSVIGGFINFKAGKTLLINLVDEIYKKGAEFGRPENVNKEKILLEYVSANPTGPFHIGHGRWAAMGSVLANLLKFYGHEVYQEFYINDAGSQINKLGNSLAIRIRQELGEDVDFPTDEIERKNYYPGDYLIPVAKKFIDQNKALLEEVNNDVIKLDVKVLSDFAKYEMEDLQKALLENFRVHFDNFYSELGLHKSGKVDECVNLLKKSGKIYQKDGDLYFTEPETAFKTSQIPEKLRKIGIGSINNIAWASSQNLVYIADDLVYSIPIYEMYLRALYSDFVGVGKIIGRLPHNFSKYDNFSVSPDCSSMVLINSQRTISYLELPGKATFVTQRYVGTQIASAGSTQSCTVFWDSKNTPVIWFQYYNTFKYSSEAFKLAESTLPTGRAVIPVALSLPEAVSFPLLSPDGTQLLFKNTSNLYVYDITPWKQSAVLACKDVVSYVWGNNHIFLGNPEAVIRWDYTKVSQNSADVLFPSSAGEYRWNSETGNPIIKNSWGIFEYDSAQTSWIASDISQLPEPSIVNSKYRVYLDTSPYSNYTNAIYIRTLEGLAKTEAFYISQQEKVSTKPQVALALDALDNADGLAYIMQVLEQYQIDGTFFINGEFIRRYPVETLRIAQSSQECASMFYISTDLVSIQDFIIDESFIRRGLARNEDDFYSLTQRELSVLWHTPYYSYNDQIVEAGNQAGYTFVRGCRKPARLFNNRVKVRRVRRG